MAAFPNMNDHMLVRDYVTANDHLQYSQLAEGIVAVLLTHCNLPAKHLDIRLDLHWTIEKVKEKFRTHIGTHIEHQRLFLKNNGETICEMSHNNKMLGFYSVKSGMEIHVVDTDPFSLSRGGGLTDVSLIQKYRMEDEIYDKRQNTLREFIREKRKVDPNYKLLPKGGIKPFGKTSQPSDTNNEKSPPPGIESVAGIEFGMRCEVQPGSRRGTVKYVGEIEQIKSGGYWVGIHFDEPVGFNDGTAKGVTIFPCLPGYGSFVRGTNLKVGDYPERDIFASDDEDEEKDKENDNVKNDNNNDEDSAINQDSSNDTEKQVEEDEDEI
eukprot:gene4562-6434_t